MTHLFLFCLVRIFLNRKGDWLDKYRYCSLYSIPCNCAIPRISFSIFLFNIYFHLYLFINILFIIYIFTHFLLPPPPKHLLSLPFSTLTIAHLFCLLYLLNGQPTSMPSLLTLDFCGNVRRRLFIWAVVYDYCCWDYSSPRNLLFWSAGLIVWGPISAHSLWSPFVLLSYV